MIATIHMTMAEIEEALVEWFDDKSWTNAGTLNVALKAEVNVTDPEKPIVTAVATIEVA